MAPAAKPALTASFGQMSALAFLLLAAAFSAAQVQTGDAAGIVARMEQAALENRAHYRPYVLTREYRMYGADEQETKAEVTAEISFVPPTRKDFRITEASGSSRGESVVRHILENEAKAAASGNAPGAITRDNYDFRLLGKESLEGRACYVLALMPKREDKALIAGKAWVDESSYMVRRIDGELAKMPSWWLKSVHITLDFDQVEGMWLQERTRAVADVRMFGRHLMTSEAVAIQAGNVEARNAARKPIPHERPFGRGSTALGTAIIRR